MYSTTFSLQKALATSTTSQEILGDLLAKQKEQSIERQVVQASTHSNRQALIEQVSESLPLPDRMGSDKLWGSSLELHLESKFNDGDHTVRLIFTEIEEAFSTFFFVSLFWCVLACLPVVIYQILCWLKPGFYVWQSNRVSFYVSGSMVVMFCLYGLVDWYILPNLLSFFYSFQIQGNSLCLNAETKVISYVSLYVFVHLVIALLVLLVGVWNFYRQRRINNWLRASNSDVTFCLPKEMREIKKTVWGIGKRETLPDSSLRGQVWWGSLLVAAMISPPEILTQLLGTSFLILWSEIVIWLSYISSYRTLTRISNCLPSIAPQI